MMDAHRGEEGCCNSPPPLVYLPAHSRHERRLQVSVVRRRGLVFILELLSSQLPVGQLAVGKQAFHTSHPAALSVAFILTKSIVCDSQRPLHSYITALLSNVVVAQCQPKAHPFLIVSISSSRSLTPSHYLPSIPHLCLIVRVASIASQVPRQSRISSSIPNHPHHSVLYQNIALYQSLLPTPFSHSLNCLPIPPSIAPVLPPNHPDPTYMSPNQPATPYPTLPCAPSPPVVRHQSSLPPAPASAKKAIKAGLTVPSQSHHHLTAHRPATSVQRCERATRSPGRHRASLPSHPIPSATSSPSHHHRGTSPALRATPPHQPCPPSHPLPCHAATPSRTAIAGRPPITVYRQPCAYR